MYVCMNACMYVCIYVHTYVCKYIYTCIDMGGVSTRQDVHLYSQNFACMHPLKLICTFIGGYRHRQGGK
jgi:hypothetical protein